MVLFSSFNDFPCGPRTSISQARTQGGGGGGWGVPPPPLVFFFFLLVTPEVGLVVGVPPYASAISVGVIGFPVAERGAQQACASSKF